MQLCHGAQHPRVELVLLTLTSAVRQPQTLDTTSRTWVNNDMIIYWKGKGFKWIVIADDLWGLLLTEVHYQLVYICFFKSKNRTWFSYVGDQSEFSALTGLMVKKKKLGLGQTAAFRNICFRMAQFWRDQPKKKNRCSLPEFFVP